MNLSEYHHIDYSYLRPSKKWFTPKTPEQLVHQDEDGKFAYRNVFYEVEIPEDVKKNANDIQSDLIQSRGTIPHWWTMVDTWRFLSEQDFDREKTVNDITYVTIFK